LAPVRLRSRTRAPDGDRGHRVVATVSSQARIDARLAALDRRVQTQVVRRGLEGNPAVRLLVGRRRWEVNLNPGVGVLASHDVVLHVRVELAEAVAVDETRGDAERPKHVAHRGGEVFAVSLVGDVEEVVHRVHAWRGRRRRQRVCEVLRVAEVRLDRGRLAVWVLRARRVDDLQGERVNLCPNGRVAIVGRYRYVLRQPVGIGRAGAFEVGRGRGRIIDGDRVTAC